MRFTRRLSILCGLSVSALSLICLAPRPAAADLIFTNYVDEFVSTVNPNVTTGTEFTVGAQSLLLSRLGLYDAGGNGLLFSHPVGIWRVSDEALLASVTIPAGTGALLVEDWRFINLASPVTLDPNTTYRIAAQQSSSTEGDPFSGTFSLGSGIASATELSVSVLGTFAYPGISTTYTRIYANGDVTPIASAAPEPASLALFALGTMTGSVVIRRRKTKARPDAT